MTEIIKCEVMTSREIAELTGKEHSNVMRDIRNIVESLGEERGQFIFEESHYINKQNKEQPMYQLDKKACLLLASGYSIVLRAKIINRWEELETKERQNVPALPDFTNPAEAARAWAAEYEAKQQALLENEKLQLENKAMKPKAEYHDKVLDTESCYTTTQIAKELEMSGRQLNILLKNMGVQYKQSGQWLLTKEYQDKGYVKTRTHLIDNERTKHTTVWTEKGREFLIDLAEDF